MAGELQFLDYEGLTQFKNSLNGVDIVTTAGDGEAYTVTIPGITELKAGISFTIIPHVASAKTAPTLNLNELGAKTIRRRLSNSTASTITGSSASWIGANKPLRVTFDGTFWIADFDRPNANDMYGTLGVEHGGTGGDTIEEAIANLGAQKKHTTATLDLPASGWVDMAQTVAAAGVTEINTVLVGANPESHIAYGENSVRATAQGAGTLTFTCETVPTEDIQANIIIMD